MMKKQSKRIIGIVGASGFIGRNIIDFIKRTSAQNFEGCEFVYIYFNKNIFSKHAIKFSELITKKPNLTDVILVAGNSNLKFAHDNFKEALIKDTSYIKEFFSNITTIRNIVYLSSAAVYHGARGVVNETDIVVPKSNYGISKLIAENIISTISELFNINLVIYRLTYSFGKYENETRLLPRIVRSIKFNEKIFICEDPILINPLPANFVAELLIKTILKIHDLITTNKIEIVNLAFPENIKPIDIINFISKSNIKLNVIQKRCFNNEFQNFALNLNKLKEILRKLNLNFPDIWDEILKYIKAS